MPTWCPKSPKVTEVLPLLNPHGLSTGDFVPALEGFFGSAAQLSALVITRLTKSRRDEHCAFMACDLWDGDYVYIWVDGVYFTVRLDEDRLLRGRRGGVPRWHEGARRLGWWVPRVH